MQRNFAQDGHRKLGAHLVPYSPSDTTCKRTPMPVMPDPNYHLRPEYTVRTPQPHAAENSDSRESRAWTKADRHVELLTAQSAVSSLVLARSEGSLETYWECLKVLVGNRKPIECSQRLVRFRIL